MKKEKTILYVDDEPINLMVFDVTFRREHKVVTGSDGLEGLKLLEQNPEVDFIVSDMQMPGMNGVEFIKKVKEKYPHLPCFILTGYDLNEEISAAVEKGLITAYFRKPFDKDEIDRYLHI